MKISRKIYKRLISLSLCLSLFLSPPLVLAAPVTVSTPVIDSNTTNNAGNALQQKLIAVEQALLGGKQTGAILDRLNNLERDYYGGTQNGSLQERIDNIYNQVFNNDYNPSAIAQMNAIEWALMHKVSMEPIKIRLANLENLIYGKTLTGSMYSQMVDLGNVAFGNNQEPIPLTRTMVPAHTLIKIKLLTPIKSANMQVGDTVKYAVAENIVYNGTLIFAQGEMGKGHVTEVKQAKNFGRNGKVDVDFSQIQAFDGRMVNTYLGEKSKEEMKSEAMAAGASLAGIALLGPIGIIGGAFVHGENVDLPVGTQLYIETKQEVPLYGVAVSTPSNATTSNNAINAKTVAAINADIAADTSVQNN